MVNDIDEKMDKTIQSARAQLATLRTGRANPDLLSKLMVEYYGTTVPLTQMGSVSAPEPMMLQVNIFDANAVKNVEKAIQLSDLNLNPQVDGSVIRIRLPELTEERRKELVKIMKKQVEEFKVGIRNVRRDIIDQVKQQEKDKEVSEDESKKLQDDVQKKTDKYINELEELSKNKEKEIISF